MAAAGTKKQQPPPPAATTVDPKFEWAEKADSYVLRLTLPGFKKDDFRVQVNGAGKLTVRGTKTGATGQSLFNKVFQLPSAANLDNIAGRFEAGVLTLTVSKRAASATAPTTIEEIKRKLPGVATPKETKPKEEEITKEDSLKKPMDEATKKTRQQEKQEEDASKSKQEQQKPAPAEVNKEEVKPKVPQAPPQVPAPVKKEEEIKQEAPQATAAAAAATPPPEKLAPKPDAATGIEKAKGAAAPESLAERVRRHSEEEQRAKAAAGEKETKAEQEKKKAAACINGWKERAMGELKGLTDMKWAEGLTDMKWADGMVQAARNNKEVVAVGIAAFSVGFLVSQKLFKK